MSELDEALRRLLQLGDSDAHPASAIIGVRCAGGTEVSAAGWAALNGESGEPVPMSRDLLLDLASVTKIASTTAILMRLVADRQVQLEDRVSGFLPEFAGGDKGRVTLYQLLTHTAGLQPWWPLYLETTHREGAILRAQRLPLETTPGTVWRYSDLGLILAGVVIERITGLPLTNAYQRFIAQPLGLSSTYGPVPSATAVTTADSDVYEFHMVDTGIPYPVPFTVHEFDGWRNRPLRGESNDGNAAHVLGGASGHAGLFSTVDDLLTLVVSFVIP